MGKALVSAKTKRQARKGSGRFVAWVARRVWRYRAGLTPLVLGGALLVAGTALAGAPPLSPALVGTLGCALLWFCGERMAGPTQRAWMWLLPDSLDDGRKGVLDRPTERGYLALLVLGAGWWLTARLQLGSTGPVQWALAAGVLVFGAPWWWHRGYRRRRPLNRWARRWKHVESNDDLKPWHGSKVVACAGTAAVAELTIELRRGLTVKKVGGDALSLCSTMNLRPGAVTIAGSDLAARRVLVRVVPRDPWGGALPHPLPTPGSMLISRTPRVEVGRYEDGHPDLYKIAQHTLVVGQTGSGKSAWLESLIAHLLAFADVRIVGADLASGATLGLWEPVLAAPLATDVPSTLELLRRLFAYIEHQERKLAARKRGGEQIDSLPPTPDDPWVFAIIDEFPDLVAGAKTAGIDVVTVLERAAKKARKVGVWLVPAGQNPTASDLGSTELRGQMTGVVGLGLDEQQSKTLWGSLRQTGWDSTPLTVGTYLLRDRLGDHSQPRVAKGLWVPPAERADLIRAATRLPRALPGVGQAILLGDAPAALGDTARHGVYEVADGGPREGVGAPRPRLTLVRGAGDGAPSRGAPVVSPRLGGGSPSRPGGRGDGLPPAPAPRVAPRTRRALAEELDARVEAELAPAHQGGVKAADLAEQFGDVSRHQVTRSLGRLEAAGRAVRNGDGTWSLGPMVEV